MRIFITGGDGLLGSNLVRELLANGHEIRVLVQEGRTVNTIDDLDLVKVTGDLLDYNSLKAAASNSIDVIFHLAASTGLWPSKCKKVSKVNIDGTRNILRLSKELNVKRLIYVGSASSFGYGTKTHPGKEDTIYKGLKYGLGYMDSKWTAHQLVMNAVKKGLPVIVVNPTFMVGAYDSVPNSGAMILAVYKQKLPGYAPGGKNFICVKDAAKGISNALHKGNIGESYIIGNENLSYKEAFRKMASVIGVNPPKLPIPRLGLLAYGRLSSFFANITQSRPKVSYAMAKVACDGHYFCAKKAVRELDLPQTPIEEGILESFNWLKSNGHVGL